MRRTQLIALLLAGWLAGLPSASARSWTVSLGVDSGPPAHAAAPGGGPAAPRLRVGLFDLRAGDDAFDLGIGWLAGSPSAAVSWRRTLTAGPVGTLVVEARAGIDGDGSAVAAAVRGTAGPVALRLEAEAGDRAPAPWTVLARAPATAPPPPDLARLVPAAQGGARLDAGVTATWRIDRSWTLDASPRLHVSAGGWAGGGTLALRRAAIATDLDVALRFDLAGGREARHAAWGVTLHHVPRRAPESRLGAWWGDGTGGAGPGVEIAWVAREAATQLTMAAGWGPPWTDRPRAYAALAVAQPWRDGTLQLGGRWVDGRSASVELAWVQPLGR